MNQGTMRILVVDDFAAWRQFVCSILEKEARWHVVSEASDGLEAVLKAQELTPDLILLDIGLPKLSGIEAARRIREVAPNSKILCVSTHADFDFVEQALATGASGYVLKAYAGSELVPAMEAVFQGKRFVSSRLKGLISAGAEDSIPREAVTPRKASEESVHNNRAFIPGENGL